MSKPPAILITGASSGIGEAFARIATTQGHNLVISGRDIATLDKLKKDIESRCDCQLEVVKSDLSKPGAAKKLYSQAAKKYKIVGLINNAGLADYGEFVDSDLKKQLAMINVNIANFTALAHCTARGMRKDGSGFIINAASVAGFVPGPLMSVYFASKNYVLALSEALRLELKPHGITVTTLCPGPTRTNLERTASTAGKGLYKPSSKLPSAESVARYGWKAMKRGKPIAIYGIKNKIFVQVVTRFLPRHKVTKSVYRLQKY